MIEGDGIGPEISQSVKDIFTAAGVRYDFFSLKEYPGIDEIKVPIQWDPIDVTPQLKNGRTVIPDRAIESIEKNYVALKGPLAVGVNRANNDLPIY